jgi:hypothetical protein
MVIHDAVFFHLADKFLFGGMNDPSADWVRAAVADRGIYFPAGQSPGQGTAEFVVRFFPGAYYAGAFGWPGMYGKGFDETLPAVQPGPIARAAEQGFVTAFIGDNYSILPTFGNVGWDVGYNSELTDHPTAMSRIVQQWAKDRPDDDALIVWWNAATHVPYGAGRAGSPAPLPETLPKTEIDATHLKANTSLWRNLLSGADTLRVAYDALAKAAPKAKRVMWLGADHSSGLSSKMARRPYRLPIYIATGLGHACGGTSEEANTPFALVYDDPAAPPHAAGGHRVVRERTSSFVAWRAFESFLDVDLDLPRQSTFSTPAFPDPHPPPVWDDRILVSVGYTATLRASLGNISYALFDSRLSQTPAWKLTPAEQLLLVGGPTRSGGFLNEELFDDSVDAYEYRNIAGEKLDDTLRMRRELSDWLAAQWEDHKHPRHRDKLVFSQPVDLELFAPRPFTALADDTPVRSADPRLAQVHGKEIVIVEGTDPVGIIEVHGATRPFVLKCSANGLPLDVLTPERPRFNLEVARTNCPLPAGPHDVPGRDEVLFSFEPAAAHPIVPQTGVPAVGNGTGPAENDELLAGMKRWGYVRDMDDKKKP